MALPATLYNRLAVPAIAAPMFLISGPDLVVEACRAGVIGSFPSLNQRTAEGFESWLNEIATRLQQSPSERIAPYAVNLIVHRSNQRVDADLSLCVKYKVPVIITSLGAVSEIVKTVHGYGGIVFHDVINMRHAEKAIAAGVDGLILVCAGAGGHTGTLNPFAFVPAVRRIFSGTIILSGAISDGQGIAAAEMLGADLAYLGTRFIATRESLASPEQKTMICAAKAADVVATSAVTGVMGNFLKDSLAAAGFDPASPQSRDLNTGSDHSHKAWRDTWSAGHGVENIDDILGTGELCRRLANEYDSAKLTPHDRTRI